MTGRVSPRRCCSALESVVIPSRDVCLALPAAAVAVAAWPAANAIDATRDERATAERCNDCSATVEVGCAASMCLTAGVVTHAPSVPSLFLTPRFILTAWLQRRPASKAKQQTCVGVYAESENFPMPSAIAWRRATPSAVSGRKTCHTLDDDRRLPVTTGGAVVQQAGNEACRSAAVTAAKPGTSIDVGVVVARLSVDVATDVDVGGAHPANMSTAS